MTNLAMPALISPWAAEADSKAVGSATSLEMCSVTSLAVEVAVGAVLSGALIYDIR